MPTLLLALLLATTPENSVFEQLTERGLSDGAGGVVRLPPPVMADGLDAAGQAKVIEGIATPSRSVERLTSRSVMAPFVLDLGSKSDPSGQRTVRTTDVYFIAYGDFEAEATEKSLDRFIRAAGSEGSDGGLPVRHGLLSEEELRKRNIYEEQPEGRKEAFAYSTTGIFDKVLLTTTRQVVITKTSESLLVASIVDPRFNDDATYPNHWQPITRDPSGKLMVGDPQPYQAMGGYVKVTRLVDPPDGLFVEIHQVFEEPKAWFGGRNLIRSKLPLAVQDGVRRFRREIQ